MNEHSVKHLELIQSAVTRMAQNSFALKGWAVTLVTALLALGARESNTKLVLVALLPTVIFWCLDAYYLRQERLFRGLYDSVRGGATEANAVFSMDTSTHSRKVPGWLRTIWSKTIVGYYGPLVVAILALATFVG